MWFREGGALAPSIGQSPLPGILKCSVEMFSVFLFTTKHLNKWNWLWRWAAGDTPPSHAGTPTDTTRCLDMLGPRQSFMLLHHRNQCSVFGEASLLLPTWHRGDAALCGVKTLAAHLLSFLSMPAIPYYTLFECVCMWGFIMWRKPFTNLSYYICL